MYFYIYLIDSLQTLKASLSSNIAMFALSLHSNLNLTNDLEYYEKYVARFNNVVNNNAAVLQGIHSKMSNSR